MEEAGEKGATFYLTQVAIKFSFYCPHIMISYLDRRGERKMATRQEMCGQRVGKAPELWWLSGPAT